MVTAVSGVTAYTGAYQSQFFSSTISPDQLYDLMKQYGVLETGDEYTDTKNLYQAMYNYYSQVMNSTTYEIPNQSNKSTVPWAHLMEQIGLLPTGDMNKDYSAFMAKINELQGRGNVQNTEGIQDPKGAQGPTENLDNLVSESRYAFQAPYLGTLSTTQVSGADIVAALNKAFLMG